MKKFLFSSCFLIILMSLTSCYSKINFNQLTKSPYTNIIENTEISSNLKDTSITSNTEEVTLLFTNNSDKEYSYDKEPHLEIKNNDTWYVMPVLQKVQWNDIGYILSKNDTYEETISIKDYYKKLDNGTYRFIKKLTSDLNSILTVIEFEVK